MQSRFIPKFLLFCTALFILVIPSVTSVYASGARVPLSPNSVTKNSIWAGYGAKSPVGTGRVSLSYILISFIQPKVMCNPILPQSQEVLFLAGIDGAPAGASDYLCVGTEVFCAVGSSTPQYRAVASGIDDPLAPISTMVIKPGDKIFGSINASVPGEGLYDSKTKVSGA